MRHATAKTGLHDRFIAISDEAGCNSLGRISQFNIIGSAHGF
jgi:hypothetical protein